jgi:hypothetical protein
LHALAINICPENGLFAKLAVACLYIVLQVYAVVDKDSDGTVDYVHKLVVGGINTPNGIALRGNSLFVASYEDSGDNVPEKGLIWRLDNIHQYALQRKVSVCSARTAVS